MPVIIRVPYSSTSYILKDEFTTNAGAPLASPRTAEPGPGTETLVQTDGQFSIASNKLVFPAQSTPVWGDQKLYAASLARLTGRTLLMSEFRISAFGSNGAMLGWAITAAETFPTLAPSFFVQSGNIIHAWSNGLNAGTLVINTDYSVAVMLRSSGGYLFVKGGIYTDWTLLWVHTTGTNTPLFPMFTNQTAAGSLDNLRVTDLPAPFDTDYGLATDRKAGSVAAGTTFVHEANCLIEFTVTTMPTSADILLDFRRQDVNNCWQARVFSNGSFILNEIVAGVTTQRANTGGGFVSAGLRLVIIADGTSIKCYINNVLRVTWATASTFQTMTAGVVRTIDVGGSVSDIVTWPRTLSGTALAALGAV